MSGPSAFCIVSVGTTAPAFANSGISSSLNWRPLSIIGPAIAWDAFELIHAYHVPGGIQMSFGGDRGGGGGGGFGGHVKAYTEAAQTPPHDSDLLPLHPELQRLFGSPREAGGDWYPQ